MTSCPVGLAVSTIGRPALRRLLDSLAASETLPVAVAVADQSPDGLEFDVSGYPFPVVVVRSGGGLSVGRNDALAALPDSATIVGFPNDDTVYPPETLGRAAQRFAGSSPPAALACASADGLTRIRALPAPGTPLDRIGVWGAIEWATFFSRQAVVAAGGFDPGLGTGCPTPWQSGEGTDLLLKILAAGGLVASAADLKVQGVGERRDLGDREFVRKNRRYARGTGFVYRRHGYPLLIRLKILLGPWLRLTSYHGSPWLALRTATARFVGRLEGLAGHTLPALPTLPGRVRAQSTRSR